MRILICRTLLIYLSVLVAMRLMGKRQLGELQPAELVSTILISNLASISIESADVPITASLVPLFLITVIEILDSILSVKYPWYAHLISGRPKAVIRDGTIDQGVLKELRLSVSDLLEALRAKDIFDIEDVAYAVVETNGSVSAAKKAERETVVLEDLALHPDSKKATVPFILDGQILLENLSYCDKTEVWLRRAASDRGISIQDILVAFGNEKEKIVWIRKENHPNTSDGSPV
jgi:uncharacterized membrane protein YcaP (DUF421 family)